MEEQDKLIQLLKEKGLKITNQRLAILETLRSCPGKHLTSEEIYDMVKKQIPEIGLATVYRNVQVLFEVGFLEKVNLDDGFVRYELANSNDAGNHRHHHLICLECGQVYSFEDDLLEQLECRIRDKMDFKVVNHEVKLYGYCSQCQQKMEENRQPLDSKAAAE